MREFIFNGLDGKPAWKAVVEEEHTGDHYSSLKAYKCIGMEFTDAGEVPMWEDHEHAVMTLKWDGCGHAGYRDPELGHNWVHFCSLAEYEETLRMMRWLWDIAQSLIPEWDGE